MGGRVGGGGRAARVRSRIPLWHDHDAGVREGVLAFLVMSSLVLGVSMAFDYLLRLSPHHRQGKAPLEFTGVSADSGVQKNRTLLTALSIGIAWHGRDPLEVRGLSLDLSVNGSVAPLTWSGTSGPARFTANAESLDDGAVGTLRISLVASGITVGASDRVVITATVSGAGESAVAFTVPALPPGGGPVPIF